MSELESNLLDALTKRIEDLEAQNEKLLHAVNGIASQLDAARRMIWLKHAFPHRPNELPVPSLKAGTVVPLDVPTGFTVILREGTKCGGIIASNGTGRH